jgi:hypothetical protein
MFLLVNKLAVVFCTALIEGTEMKKKAIYMLIRENLLMGKAQYS